MIEQAREAPRSLFGIRRVRADPIRFLSQFAGDRAIVEFPFPTTRGFLLNDPVLIQDVLVTNSICFANRRPSIEQPVSSAAAF
jgi:hypothetical protein